MGLLTFALNVTLDGCCDHREGIADDDEAPLVAQRLEREVDGAPGAVRVGHGGANCRLAR